MRTEASTPPRHHVGLTVTEMVIFAMLGAMMYASKIVMEVLPNIHLLGMFIVALTVVYRWRALYPLYVYILLQGVTAGFSLWWMPYLYIWTVLWGAVMLLPRRMPRQVAMVVYPVVCALHGFLYGVLYAPFQALAFGLDLAGTLAWIATGLPFDITHGISNFCAGLLIVPLVALLQKLDRSIHRRVR